MLEEPGLNPQTFGARFEPRHAASRGREADGRLGPQLSTGNAERRAQASTSPDRAQVEEVMG